MKYLFLIALLISSQSQADFLFIQKGQAYLIQSKYSPDKTGHDNARFLKIAAKEDSKAGTVNYTFEGISSPEALSYLKTPMTPKVIAGEGCGKNPMVWLYTAKILGNLKSKDSAIYVQIPPAVSSLAKTPVKCPNSDRFSNSSPLFSTGQKDFNVMICADDLNNYLIVMNGKAIEADLTITDNCP